MTRPRDSFWSRVQNAESEFALAYTNSDAGRALSYAEQKALSTKIAKSAWWKKRRPDIKVFSVQQNRSRSICSFETSSINGERAVGVLHIQPDASTIDVLHLIAHLLHADDTAWHGAEYAKAMLDMVGKYIGMDARRALAQLYKLHNVKTVVWSQEAKDRAKSRYAERDLKALLDELKSSGEGVTPSS